MHKSTDTLTPAQVYRFAVDFCQPYLRFHAVGKVTAHVDTTNFAGPIFCTSPRPCSASSRRDQNPSGKTTRSRTQTFLALFSMM